MGGNKPTHDARRAVPTPTFPSTHELAQCFTSATGTLTHEQLQGVFAAFPVELTFVDHEDRVQFFTESHEPIFARTTAVLGRKVQHCHPAKSVDTVDRVLSDLRSGRQDVAQFWLDLKGRFVHVRYLAVRSPDGEYLGTLEVTQDLTPLRALKGERRLLQYDLASDDM